MSAPELEKWVVQASADLAGRLGVQAGSIRVKEAEAVQWSDASLGCPKPGFGYAQVIVPGYRILLEVNDKEYDYHVGQNRMILCEK